MAEWFEEDFLEEPDEDEYAEEEDDEFLPSPMGFDDDGDGEGFDAYDAALIWMSNGKDEDYMFGYSEEELEDAL